MWETCDTNPIGPCKRDARRASDIREARASLASRCHAKVMQVGRVPLHCFGFRAIRSVEMSCLAGEPTGANEMTCLPEWGARQRRLEFHRSLQVAVTIAPSLGEHCSARTYTKSPARSGRATTKPFKKIRKWETARGSGRVTVSEARRAFHQRRERFEASEVRARQAEEHSRKCGGRASCPRQGQEQVQRLCQWRQWHLPAWEAEGKVQRVWRP